MRPAHFSSNESAEPGRLVLFLVDKGNIARGSGRNIFASAARFIGTLPPADRVGLAVVPGPGPSIEFTPERDEIRKALRGLLGQGHADRAAFRVPLTEAVAFLVNHDQFRWQEYLDLECAFRISPEQVEQCRQELEGEAFQVLANYRERSLQSRRALVAVLRGLRAVEGSKTVVLISEGLWTETLAEVTEIGEAVAEAQVTLYVILVEKATAQAEFDRGHAPTPEEQDLETAALYDLAGMSRGAVLPVIGTADAPVRPPRPGAHRLLPPRLRAGGEGPRRPQPLGEGRGVAPEDDGARPDPAQHPGRDPDAGGAARGRPALAAPRPRARRARRDLRDAGRGRRQGAPPDRGARWRARAGP